MDFTLVHCLFLLSAGLVAGFVDTLAGGGGMITIPALLTVGVPPHLALGTNKLGATFGVGNATRIFLKKKLLTVKIWYAAMFAAFFGSILGALVVHCISATKLHRLIPIMVLILVFYTAVRHKRYSEKQAKKIPGTKSSSLLMGSLGFYDGLFGPGTGSFLVGGIMWLYHFDILEATAVAKLMNFISNAAALLTFMLMGNVDYLTGLTLALSMLLGASLGAHAAVRFGVGFIRPIFLTMVCLLTLHLLITT